MEYFRVAPYCTARCIRSLLHRFLRVSLHFILPFAYPHILNGYKCANMQKQWKPTHQNWITAREISEFNDAITLKLVFSSLQANECRKRVATIRQIYDHLSNDGFKLFWFWLLIANHLFPVKTRIQIQIQFECVIDQVLHVVVDRHDENLQLVSNLTEYAAFY